MERLLLLLLVRRIDERLRVKRLMMLPGSLERPYAIQWILGKNSCED